jgi:hypothetical protein
LFGVNNTNVSPKTYTARKHFYTVAQVSKWVRPGAQRIGINGSTWPLSPLAAFKHETLGHTTIVGINSSGSTVLDGNLDNLPAATAVDLYYTTSGANLVFGGRTAVSGGNFNVNIPGDCVFTLVTVPTVDTTPPLLTVTTPEFGALIGGSTVTITGTATDAERGDHGVASVTVNGGRATNDTASGSASAQWSRVVNLVAGTNRFTIVARDSLTNAVTNVLHVIADTTRPTVAISFPRTASRLLTNPASLNLTGTAADNRGVTAVYGQLNGGPWLAANGTTNWTFPVTLTAGTNVARVFAEDVAGFRSLTNVSTFQFVVPMPLTLERIGNGTVSGATNGQLLEVGRTYTLTARSATGFVLTNWSTCADELLTNRTTLSFRMASNTCLRAVFADVQRPTVTTLSPRNGARVLTNNGLVTLRGTARDNAGVVNVRCQLNGGAWVSASGTTNWSLTLPMGPGTNVARVCAEDAAGWPSLTNNFKFVHVPTSPLNLAVIGAGRVSGATNGQLLEIGRLYTLTAQAGTGFAFTNWTDCNDVVLTNRSTLAFRMQVDQCLRARFYSLTPATNQVVAGRAGLPEPNVGLLLRPNEEQLTLELSGPVGTTIIVESSADLHAWIPVTTNLLGAEALQLPVEAQSPRKFFRARSVTP